MRFVFSEGDDIEIKRRVSLFSLPPPVYRFIFISLSSFLFFSALLHGLEVAEKGTEIKVNSHSLAPFS